MAGVGSQMSEENKTVEVPANNTLYVIKDLKEGKDYIVQMRSVTKVDMLSPLSDSVIGNQEFNSFTIAEIAGIICGVIVCAMFIAAGSFCIIRNCYQRWKFEPRQIRGIVNDASVDNVMNKKRTDPLYTVNRGDDVYRGYREPMLRRTSTDSGMGDEPWMPPANDKKLEINRLDLFHEDYIRFFVSETRTATSSEQSGTGVYSIYEPGQSVHTYNDGVTNNLDARVEEDIVTRDGVIIVPQRLFAVKADSPVAVADVGLNSVTMANRTVGGYLESTIAPVPMTTSMDESAGTDNGENIEEVKRTFEEETELQDQSRSSSGTLPDFVLSMAEKGDGLGGSRKGGPDEKTRFSCIDEYRENVRGDRGGGDRGDRLDLTERADSADREKCSSSPEGGKESRNKDRIKAKREGEYQRRDRSRRD